MVKLAYNREDEKNYVSVGCWMFAVITSRADNDPCFVLWILSMGAIRQGSKLHGTEGRTFTILFVAGNENFVKEKAAKESRNVFQKASTEKGGRQET